MRYYNLYIRLYNTQSSLKSGRKENRFQMGLFQHIWVRRNPTKSFENGKTWIITCVTASILRCRANLDRIHLRVIHVNLRVISRHRHLKPAVRKLSLSLSLSVFYIFEQIRAVQNHCNILPKLLALRSVDTYPHL